MDLQVQELCRRVIKYLIEGVAVAIAATVLPKAKPDYEATIMIALVATATFAILDLLAPNSPLGNAARTGAGFGIGANLVGFPN